MAGKGRIADGPADEASKPASVSTSPVTLGKKYMSAAKELPVRIISAAAQRLPMRT